MRGLVDELNGLFVYVYFFVFVGMLLKVGKFYEGDKVFVGCDFCLSSLVIVIFCMVVIEDVGF
ncbi:hypothetical protein DF186_13890 [Enterococcus hirae]|nr:hypothetical protein DF186_13890 [Enterococcus hirae]